MKIFKHNKIDKLHVVVLFPTRNRILINVQVPGNINQNDCFFIKIVSIASLVSRISLYILNY